MKASLVIPNWNGIGLLKDCLTSLNKQTFRNFEIIVVDNGSIDNSVNYIKDNFPKVKIIKLNKNYGFAKAINEGVKQSIAEYVVFLNNDTWVDKNWLKYLILCADKHPETISINSKLLNFYQRKIIDGVGILINEVGQAKSIGYQEEDKGQYDNLKYIFGATGGASLFRRMDFIKAGMFDESYFMYSEEVDFAFRAQFLGYKSMFCPSAVVYHKHKATALKRPDYIEYWQFRNMIVTIIKDYPTALLFKHWRWLKIILVYLNTIFYQLKKGYIWPPILTQVYLIINLPGLLIKRYRIQQIRKVKNEYIDSFLVNKDISFWGLPRTALKIIRGLLK